MFALMLALTAPPFAYTGSLSPRATVTVRNVDGDVRVRDGGVFTVRAARTATTGDPAAVVVRVDRRDGDAVVCVRAAEHRDVSCYDRLPGGTHDMPDVRVDMEITVPAGTTVDAASVNGAVGIAHDGAVTAGTVNGRVDVDATSVREAATVNGDVSVRLRGAQRGSLHLRSVSGAVALRLPASDGATIDAHTLSGDITIPGVAAARPGFGPGASASATFGDGALHVRLDTVSGAIAVTR